jgi:hypothetical protein
MIIDEDGDPSIEEFSSSETTIDTERDDKSEISEQSQMTTDASDSYEQINRNDNLTVVDLLDSIDDVVEAVLDIFVPEERRFPSSDETNAHQTIVPLKKTPLNQRQTFIKSQSNRSISTGVDIEMNDVPQQKVLSPLMYAQKIGTDTVNWISSKGKCEAGKINLPVSSLGMNSPTNQSSYMVSDTENNLKVHKREKQNSDKVALSVSSFGITSPPQEQEEVQGKNERKKRWFQRKKASSVQKCYNNPVIDDDNSETDFWDTVLDIVSPESKDAEEELKSKKKTDKFFRRSKRKNVKSFTSPTMLEDRDDISQLSSMKSVFGGTRV